MDLKLNQQELDELADVLPSPIELEIAARRKAREADLAELKEHLERLAREINKAPTLGLASIEVPEVWLAPIEDVLVRRGLAYTLKAPPQGTNMATVVVRWHANRALKLRKDGPQRDSRVSIRGTRCSSRVMTDKGTYTYCKHPYLHSGECEP